VGVCTYLEGVLSPAGQLYYRPRTVRPAFPGFLEGLTGQPEDRCGLAAGKIVYYMK